VCDQTDHGYVVVIVQCTCAGVSRGLVEWILWCK